MFSKRILGLAIVAMFILTACGTQNQPYSPAANPTPDNKGGYEAQILKNFLPLQPNGYFIAANNPRNATCTRGKSPNGTDIFDLEVDVDYRNNVPPHSEYRSYTQVWGNIKPWSWLKEGDIVFFGPLQSLDSNSVPPWPPSGEFAHSNNFFKDFPFTDAEIIELWVDGKPVSRVTITFVCTGTIATATVTNEP